MKPNIKPLTNAKLIRKLKYSLGIYSYFLNLEVVYNTKIMPEGWFT